MSDANTTPTLALNPDAIRHANDASQFDAGDVLAHEAEQVYTRGLSAFEPRPEWAPEQASYAQRRAADWRDLVQTAYNDLLHRRASWVPVSVAGPSNYPAQRMQKRCEAEMNAGKEWSDKMNRFLDNTQKALAALVPVSRQIEAYRTGDDSPISSDDPAALEKLIARLEYLKAEQENMKAMNAWYRKHKTCKGFGDITDEAAVKMDESIKKGYSFAQIPFPAYHLSNNTANIRRLEERCAALEKARKASQSPDTNASKIFDGLRVEEDAADNRIRLYFDEKPGEETRSLLKSHGFRWSPNAGAWQRQLNGNGRYSAQQVVEKLITPLSLSDFAARIAQ
ncbi:MAG: hypothetical protein LLF96_04200 [Eubacteriales bacterium]|nr:hypothetical protein [Eubacteriales bacterium]